MKIQKLKNDKLFIKNGFHYLILQLGNLKEFLILSNENIKEQALIRAYESLGKLKKFGIKI